MNELNGNVGAGYAIGMQHNGQYQDDSDLSGSADSAGGTFRNSTPGDSANQQSVANRSSNVYMPNANFMNQVGADTKAGDHEIETGEPAAADYGISDGDTSDLSSYDSNAESEQLEIRDLEQHLVAGLTVDDSGSNEDVELAGLTVDDSGSNEDVELAGLTAPLRNLKPSHGQAASEDEVKDNNTVKELGQKMVALLKSSSDVELIALHDIVQGLQKCLEPYQLRLDGLGVTPEDLKICLVGSENLVDVKFDHFINVLTNTGVMFGLNETISAVNTYLGDRGVTFTGPYLRAKGEDRDPVLHMPFTRNNDVQLTDFTFALDGQSETDRNSFAKELNNYLQEKVFLEVRNSGTSVPEVSFEVYIRDLFRESPDSGS